MASICRQDIQSAVGNITLLSSGDGLCFLGLPGCPEDTVASFLSRFFSDAEITEGGDCNRRVEIQLKSYFSGTLTQFEIDLDLKTDGFSREVLLKVNEIPYGKLRTYKDIAKELGNPGASQAVGNANGANPIPIIIPCHRVVASNGLGGYGGGLPLKKKLLAIEQQNTIF